MMIAWKDAGVIINSAHVAAVTVLGGEAVGTVVCGMHEGRPIGVEASERDWRATLEAIAGKGGLIVEMPLRDEDHPGSTIHVVGAHLCIVGQIPDATDCSRLSLSQGTHFEVRMTGREIMARFAAAQERLQSIIRAAVAPATPVQ